MVPDQSDFHIFSIIDICIIYLFCTRSYHATPSRWLTLPLICPNGSIKKPYYTLFSIFDQLEVT